MINCFTVEEVTDVLQRFEYCSAYLLNEANEDGNEEQAGKARAMLGAVRGIAQRLNIELENHFNPLKGI